MTRPVLSNILRNFFGYSSSLVLFTISVPIFINILGMEGYGIWVICNSLIGVIGILNQGVTDSTTKFVAESRNPQSSWTTTEVVQLSELVFFVVSITIFAAGTLILPHFLATFGVPDGNLDSAKELLFLLTLSSAVNIMNSSWFSVYRGLERYDYAVNITLFRDFSRVIISLVFALNGFGILSLGLGAVIAAVSSFFINVRTITRLLSWKALVPTLGWSGFGPFLRFSSLSIVGSISTVAKNSIVNLLIGRYIGPSSVPLFYIPFQIGSQLVSLSSVVSNVLFPIIASRRKIDDTATSYLSTDKSNYGQGLHLRWSLTTFFVSGAIILSVLQIWYPVFSFWLGADFADSAKFTAPFILVLFAVIAINTPSYNYLLGSGLIKVIAVLQFVVSAGVILATFFFIEKGGVLAVALSYSFELLTLYYIIYALADGGGVTFKRLKYHLLILMFILVGILIPFAIRLFTNWESLYWSIAFLFLSLSIYGLLFYRWVGRTYLVANND